MNHETCRILVADDTPALHEAYRNIFATIDEPSATAFQLGTSKFATDMVEAPMAAGLRHEITYVHQGEEAIAAAAAAQVARAPFALAILDVRMPPGIDGVQTARQLRARYPDLQIVLCTAYSDYSWSDLTEAFPESDGLLLLKKPFDAIEVQQLANALCRKWQLAVENRSLIRDLESRVAIRTAQLAKTSDELALALKAALIADRAKHDFLRCVSHELNTPLNGVQGVASILALSEDPATQQMSNLIIESSERLHRLFTRILLYLELESLAPSSLNPTHASELIARAVTPQCPAARDKGLSLQSSFEAPSGLMILGDPKLLVVAIENLVENAIKFTASGAVNVHIQHHPERQALIIEVTDTGDNVSTAKLDEHSALFAVGDASLTRKNDGIGIGLALVLRIARHFSGTLKASPRSPDGNVFTLTIPCTVTP
jgi:signal transduction histidine kinase